MSHTPALTLFGEELFFKDSSISLSFRRSADHYGPWLEYLITTICDVVGADEAIVCTDKFEAESDILFAAKEWASVGSYMCDLCFGDIARSPDGMWRHKNGNENHAIVFDTLEDKPPSLYFVLGSEGEIQIHCSQNEHWVTIHSGAAQSINAIAERLNVDPTGQGGILLSNDQVTNQQVVNMHRTLNKV